MHCNCRRSAKHIPGKANSEAQEKFIEQYTQIKENKATEDKIYFIDAAHVLHNSQPAYGWIRKGREMVLQSNTGRRRINLNGAYCIENHTAIVQESDTVNAQSTIALFILILNENAKYFLFRSSYAAEFRMSLFAFSIRHSRMRCYGNNLWVSSILSWTMPGIIGRKRLLNFYKVIQE